MRALLVLALAVVPGCERRSQPPPSASEATKTETDTPLADVTGVEVEGDPGAYKFAVTVQSPDTGCARYANWWEVVSEDGKLLYRRILRHSHVDDQPFTRGGGPVDIAGDDKVIVRAHMHPGGYGGAAMIGTPDDGFTPKTDLAAGFAADLAKTDPLPEGCAH